MIDTHFERSLAAASRSRRSSPQSTRSTVGSGTGRRATTCASTLGPGRRAARRARLRRPVRQVRDGRRRAARPGRRRRPPGVGHRTTGLDHARHRRAPRRALADPPAWRDGAEPLRIVDRARRGRRGRAYATFRRKENWADGSPAGIVRVREAAAVDAAATHRLWSFLLDLDLMASVEGPMLPADDPLLLLLVDQRGAKPRLTDNVWVRLLDLPVALAGRRYSAPLDVVLDVTDDAPARERRPVAAHHGLSGARTAPGRRRGADRRRRRPGARRPRARCRLPRWALGRGTGPRRSRRRADRRVRCRRPHRRSRGPSRPCAAGCSSGSARTRSAGRCGAGAARPR